jgi:hypothetical protein
MTIVLEDTDQFDREPEVAHPDDYLADINWATAFEFGDTR